MSQETAVIFRIRLHMNPAAPRRNNMAGSGPVCARTTPTCCNSEASFIGEESACCQPVQQQIPRAAKLRFGMTNALEISNCTTTTTAWIGAVSRFVYAYLRVLRCLVGIHFDDRVCELRTRFDFHLMR